MTIFAKMGLSHVDPLLSTTVRSLFMAGILTVTAVVTGKLTHVNFGSQGWVMVFLSAVAGTVSWLCYFTALKFGPAASVAALDRLSLVGTVVLAALLLGETITLKSGLGLSLMMIGALLMR
jgi:transporter family protein